MRAVFIFFIILCTCFSECLCGWCPIPGNCPTDFKPVCGKKGNDQATFPNLCKFQQSQCLEGWEFLKDGDCYSGQKVPLEIVSIEKIK